MRETTRHSASVSTERECSGCSLSERALEELACRRVVGVMQFHEPQRACRRHHPPTACIRQARGARTFTTSTSSAHAAHSAARCQHTIHAAHQHDAIHLLLTARTRAIDCGPRLPQEQPRRTSRASVLHLTGWRTPSTPQRAQARALSAQRQPPRMKRYTCAFGCVRTCARSCPQRVCGCATCPPPGMPVKQMVARIT